MSLLQARFRSANTRGITVVELLVALAVLGIALASLAAVLGGASRAYRLTSERVERSEATQLVTQVLQYHLRLAGYVGADPDDRIASLCGPSVAVPEDADAVTIRYYEDRRYGAATATNNFTCGLDDVTVVTFDAADGFFRQNSAPVIGGVESFEVVAYFDSLGFEHDTFPFTEATLSTATGISVEVTFENGDVAAVVVPFVNPQREFIDLTEEE